ncbi:MAG: hypothetical protein OEX00_10115, partial [Gammaproteobacteria bacterium]|nr:hypothetical protein [Gammaproteobacteria bacterium]
RNTIGELERENGALRDKVALLDRSKQVDQQAYTQVDDTIKKLQEEILELREEVGFYRGIVSPEESSSGLRVERFKVDQTSNDRLYRYKLVITQVLKNHRMARGEAKITIEGLQGGEPRELSLSSVSTDKKGSLRYRFKYFQKFEGDLMLPDGFSPRSVMVSLDGMGKNKNIEKTFQWPTFGIEGEQVPDRGATS